MSDLIDRQALLKQIDIDSDGEPGYYGDTWKFIDTIKSMPPATQLSTNLAEVGTDCISRQAAIDAIDGYMEKLRIHIATPNDTESYSYARGLLVGVINDIKQLPSVQPEIIRCAECKWFQCNMRQDGYLPKGVDEFECRHWCGYCDPTDFCSYAERREVTT